MLSELLPNTAARSPLVGCPVCGKEVQLTVLRTSLSLAVALLLVSLMLGCSSHPATVRDQVVGAVPAPTEKDLYADEISQTGWNIPSVEAGRKERIKRRETQGDNSRLEVTETTYRPVRRPAAELPYQDESNGAWYIREITEFSYGSSRPFCYLYKASPVPEEGTNGVAVTDTYRVCDNDGDGRYETRGRNFGRVIVPEWAKKR